MHHHLDRLANAKVLLYQKCQFAAARASLLKLPHDDAVCFLLGDCEFALGNHDQAREAYDACLKKNPHHLGAAHRLEILRPAACTLC